jgi:hypothetical protein
VFRPLERPDLLSRKFRRLELVAGTPDAATIGRFQSD